MESRHSEEMLQYDTVSGELNENDAAGHGDLVKEYQDAAMSGSYQNLLAVTQLFVEVE